MFNYQQFHRSLSGMHIRLLLPGLIQFFFWKTYKIPTFPLWLMCKEEGPYRNFQQNNLCCQSTLRFTYKQLWLYRFRPSFRTRGPSYAKLPERDSQIPPYRLSPSNIISIFFLQWHRVIQTEWIYLNHYRNLASGAMLLQGVFWLPTSQQNISKNTKLFSIHFRGARNQKSNHWWSWFKSYTRASTGQVLLLQYLSLEVDYTQSPCGLRNKPVYRKKIGGLLLIPSLFSFLTRDDLDSNYTNVLVPILSIENVQFLNIYLLQNESRLAGPH